jgi:hypothetical protein
MSTPNETYFLSVQNLQNLINIFSKFLKDRYSVDYTQHNINLKRIIFETMQKISKDDTSKNLLTVDLNKITLSIVKNVIKNKIYSDKSFASGMNSALMRDNDVNDKPNSLFSDDASMQRPMQSNDSFPGNVDDPRGSTTKSFQDLSALRQSERVVSNTTNPNGILDNEEDDAMTSDEFIARVSALSKLRYASDSIDELKTNASVDNPVSIVPTNNNTVYPSSNSSPVVESFDNNIHMSTTTQASKRNESIGALYKGMDARDPRMFYENMIGSTNESIKTQPSIGPLDRGAYSNPIRAPEIQSFYLVVDSRDRNVTVYPDTNNYVIQLEDGVKNVTEVELIYALYHKKDEEFYVNLQIEEFLPDTISNNQYSKSAFVQLPMTDYVNEFTNNRISAKKIFKQPISKLNRLTIKFVNHDGQFNKVGEHFLKFEIKCYNSSEVIESTRVQDMAESSISTNLVNQLTTKPFENDDVDPMLTNEVNDTVDNMVERLLSESP